MCGLVALWSKRNRPVAQQVFDLYKKQSTRGTKGYGYLAIDGAMNLVSVQRAKTEDEIKKLLLKETAPMILFHHRFPTSTENTLGTTHPMFVSNEELEFDYYFAHNGKVHNTDILKKNHKADGYDYHTEFNKQVIATYRDDTREVIEGKGLEHNDSESLAIELARHLEDKSDKVGTLGPAAFWGVRLVKGTDQVVSVYYGRNHGRELGTVSHKKYEGVSSEHSSLISPMLIYSYDTGDSVLYEQGFPIDENKTFVPVKSSRVMTELEREVHRNQHRQLQNKYYTFPEMKETGLADAAFAVEFIDHQCYYVPKRYAAYRASRMPLERPKQMGLKAPEVESDFEMTTEQSEGARRRLESMAAQHAQLQTKREKLHVSRIEGYISESTFKQLDEGIESQQDALEDTMSSLGLSEDEMQEVMELCVELEDYQNSIKHERV